MKPSSHMLLPRGQQRGMLFLVVLLIGLMVFLAFASFESEPILTTESPEIQRALQELDSLRWVAQKEKAPKIYPFNPNFMTDYRAYVLGVSPEAWDRLQAFRKQDKWIHSASDFQMVTGVSDSLLETLRPYFKFPEWVNQRRRTSVKKYHTTEIPVHQRLDLNSATTAQLQEVYGIGPAFSKRIIEFRERLGGFSDERQLYLVWGLNDTVVNNVLRRFTVKDPKPLPKININTASASDLATLPGISFETAKTVWEFRKLREEISDLSELDKIEGLTARQLRVFQLYLSVE
ncbi:ComEA family DNA-binding protein [Altibacter sp. HG106]|uniref:ComEA family DNA-binding protein n=1 Tax=Altibacter sp. HG106 TaxID=3023937 RepID=UPI0023502EE3|nr:helix-hairpin-helix domain-containing protein [Altibacter sp. HG106]MDC7996109.1 helix-hairpin-helix domain-containing protein [Altibacter sp. HG106]